MVSYTVYIHHYQHYQYYYYVNFNCNYHIFADRQNYCADKIISVETGLLGILKLDLWLLSATCRHLDSHYTYMYMCGLLSNGILSP